MGGTPTTPPFQIVWPQLDGVKINPDGTLPIALIQSIRKAYEYINTDRSLVKKGGGGDGGGLGSGTENQEFWRVFDIHDTRPRTNAGPVVNVQETGTGISITGVLRKVITADLTVVVNVNAVALGTITIPHATPVDQEVSVAITTKTLVKSQAITFDITASDSSKDNDGVAVITVKWGIVTQVTVGSTNMGAYDPTATYSKGQTVQSGGSTYLSLQDSNTGHALTDPAWWTIAAAGGTPGTLWFSGSGAPSSGTGSIGDFYLNIANGDYYKKTGSSTWTLQGNLTGPTGPPSVASGLVLLEEHTASSSSSLDFTTRNVTGQSGATFQSDYDEYQIEVVNIIPATNATGVNINVSTNGGSSYDATSSYEWLQFYAYYGGAGENNSASDTRFPIGNTNISNDSHYGLCGTVKLFSPLSTSLYKMFVGLLLQFDSSVSRLVKNDMDGVYKNTAAINAFRVSCTSGNITSGTIRVYGIAK